MKNAGETVEGLVKKVKGKKSAQHKEYGWG